MKSKNSWTKQYEVVEKKVIRNGEKATEKVTVLSKHGMKPSRLEIKFSKRINNMKTEKPKKKGLKESNDEN